MIILMNGQVNKRASRRDNMKKVETEKYEGYTIEVYEQEPNVEYPLNDDDWDNLDCLNFNWKCS